MTTMGRHEQEAKIVRHYEKGLIEFGDMVTDILVIRMATPCERTVCTDCAEPAAE